MAVIISGCASIKEKHSYGVITGAVVGGVATGVDDDDNAAAGALVGGVIGWLVCQESDSDGDGVNDKNDACPRTPPGVSVDERGCSTDSDGDGVAWRGVAWRGVAWRGVAWQIIWINAQERQGV